MRYRVLGEVEVLDADSGAQQIGGPNQRLVLAALLAHPNEVVSTHALLDALWEDDPPASAVPTLRTALVLAACLLLLTGIALAATGHLAPGIP